MLHPLYLAVLVPAACAGILALGRFPGWKKAWLLALSALFLALQGGLWWLTLLLTGLAWLAPLFGTAGAAVYAALAAGTLAAVKLSGMPWPLGLSFAALQGIAYAVDAARNQDARGSLPDVMLYGLFFPKLSAGPVCRFTAFRMEAQSARVTWDSLEQGLQRIAFGLGRKLLIADSLYPMAMAAFGDGAHPLALLLSLAACPLYVYFDFSGCTMIALGTAQLLGMQLPENFDRPFAARSMRQFWRRWHMSLSGFFRDYVYIPLGGSRRGRARTLRNVAAVFLLMGLWHGFSWSYLLFGAWHALLMVLEHAGLLHPDGWRRPIARAYTLLCMAVGFVLFMAPGLPGICTGGSALRQTLMCCSPGAVLAMLTALAICCLEGLLRLPDRARRFAALALLALSWMTLMAEGYAPMLYAQF